MSETFRNVYQYLNGLEYGCDWHSAQVAQQLADVMPQFLRVQRCWNLHPVIPQIPASLAEPE